MDFAWSFKGTAGAKTNHLFIFLSAITFGEKNAPCSCSFAALAQTRTNGECSLWLNQQYKPVLCRQRAVLFYYSCSKEIKVVLSLREEDFHWTFKGTAGASRTSAALILWTTVILSPGNNYAILSVISWVVADSVCICCGAVLQRDNIVLLSCFPLFVPTLPGDRWALFTIVTWWLFTTLDSIRGFHRPLSVFVYHFCTCTHHALHSCVSLQR